MRACLRRRLLSLALAAVAVLWSRLPPWPPSSHRKSHLAIETFSSIHALCSSGRVRNDSGNQSGLSRVRQGKNLSPNVRSPLEHFLQSTVWGKRSPMVYKDIMRLLRVTTSYCF